MWKIFAGFIVLAAIAIFLLFKGGDEASMQGESAAQSSPASETTATAPIPTPASAPVSAPAPATAQDSPAATDPSDDGGEHNKVNKSASGTKLILPRGRQQIRPE